jgi:hypothetical protein
MINVFMATADVLLQRHYGIGVADTDLSEDDVAAEHLAEGRRPFEAVNAYVTQISLGRIDRELHLAELSREPLTRDDEAHVAACLAKNLVLTQASDSENDGTEQKECT